MLTDEIVDDFIANKLGIRDWRHKLEDNKFQLLKELMIAHGINRYWQNVSWSCVLKGDRKIPTEEECIHHGTKGSGGWCIHLNYFFYLILAHLKFDASVIGVEFPQYIVRRCHIAIVVRMTSDEIYLIDVGVLGRHVLVPVPLHQLPFTGKTGGFTYEYRFNKEKNVYEKLLKDGCSYHGKFDDDERMEKGFVDFHFDLTPLKFEDWHVCYEEIFSPRATSPFMDVIMLGRLTAVRDPRDDFEYVAIRPMFLIEGTQDSYRETRFESYDAMVPAILKYFPNVDHTELKAAIFNCNETRRIKSGVK